jgi:hypothetical protein
MRETKWAAQVHRPLKKATMVPAGSSADNAAREPVLVVHEQAAGKADVVLPDVYT